ncbi:P-loop containing nucleoside triphosphate hydrolase protein [Nemania abortiva]|nr:P-loop containing nucleoside triphosphate hydrolase protein [Nemania abortiva]
MEPTQFIPRVPTDDKPSARIKYRVEYRHRKTNELVSHRDTEEPAINPEKKDELNGAAFVVITTYSTGKAVDQLDEESLAQAISTVVSPPVYSIHLTSPAIINALRSVVQYYPSQDLTGDIMINWPYPILVHHYDELQKFREDVAKKDEKELCKREERAYEDLGLLLQYLDDSVMPEVLQERERNAKGYFTFEYMWVMLKPGTTFLGHFSTDAEFYHPHVVEAMVGGSLQYPPMDWEIHSWDMRYDGRYLGRYTTIGGHKKFDGQKPLSFTIVGDLTNRSELPEIVSNQLKYGERYWNLLQKQCRQYKGKTQDVLSKEVDGLVMVDMKSYYADGDNHLRLKATADCRNWTSDCKCEVCKSKIIHEKDGSKIVSLFEDYNHIAIESRRTLTPHQYFLCYPEIPAFVFKTRTWEILHVRDFAEPEFDEDLIDHLVMEPRRKSTLKALAKCFARLDKNGEKLKGEPWTADFIQGKGHGLIFLLHGRPGVGKTYTAECIAAFTKRPLMVLTSSDIGTDPAEIEVNLTKHFKAAKSWGAVLLIDEADVFMERRSTADLVRNSLVAGFLRALEFYDGILFLTTNRVGSFDDAFISRVHVQLYYPDFDDNQRQQVWGTFIEKLEKERSDSMRLNIDAKEYIRGSDMRALAWNGREIRNAFQTAVSLAEYDAKKGEDGRTIVTDEHLRAVVELSRDFKAYLNELHKGDEAKRAERKYERLDSYTGS